MYRTKEEGYIFEYNDKGFKKKFSIISIALYKAGKNPKKLKIATTVLYIIRKELTQSNYFQC